MVKLWWFAGGMWCFDGRFFSIEKLSLFEDLFSTIPILGISAGRGSHVASLFSAAGGEFAPTEVDVGEDE